MHKLGTPPPRSGEEDREAWRAVPEISRKEGINMRKRWMAPLLAALMLVLANAPAFAQERAGGDAKGWIALAAGLAVGIAAVGAGLGQGRAVAAAMESIGRNPNAADRIQTPMIIGIAFMEALAIYALIIAFFLQGKV
jgi:F-type H+-transporting ATPase subunit c